MAGIRRLLKMLGHAGLLSASTILPAQALQIFVVDSTSAIVTLDVEASDTIEAVKAKIKDKQGFPGDSQYLYFNEVFLENDLTLSDYGITKENILDLVATTALDGLPPSNRKWNLGIKDATSTPGSGWTVWNTTTPLDLSALSDGAITLNLFGFNGESPGLPSNYSAGASYALTFLNATGGISGFSPSIFSITGLFANQSSVEISGDQLVLNLNAQPVPGPPGVMLAPVAFHWSRRLRRRMAIARVVKVDQTHP